jgi:hypothetical protein
MHFVVLARHLNTVTAMQYAYNLGHTKCSQIDNAMYRKHIYKTCLSDCMVLSLPKYLNMMMKGSVSR